MERDFPRVRHSHTGRFWRLIFLWCRSLIDPFGTEQGWTDGTDEDGIHGTINMTTSLLAFGF